MFWQGLWCMIGLPWGIFFYKKTSFHRRQLVWNGNKIHILTVMVSLPTPRLENDYLSSHLNLDIIGQWPEGLYTMNLKDFIEENRDSMTSDKLDEIVNEYNKRIKRLKMDRTAAWIAGPIITIFVINVIKRSMLWGTAIISCFSAGFRHIAL